MKFLLYNVNWIKIRTVCVCDSYRYILYGKNNNKRATTSNKTANKDYLKQ